VNTVRAAEYHESLVVQSPRPTLIIWSSSGWPNADTFKIFISGLHLGL
jgi:hypothetical protein